MRQRLLRRFSRKGRRPPSVASSHPTETAKGGRAPQEGKPDKRNVSGPSGSGSVGFVTDHTGLVIYGPQPPLNETVMSPGSSAKHRPMEGGPQPYMEPAHSGIVYVDVGSGSYVTIDASQLEPSPYTVPFQGSSGPYQGSSGPYHGSTGPYHGSTGPYQGPTGPYQGSVGPYQGSSGPYQGSSGPYQGSSGPYQGSTGPYQGSSGPYQGSTGPYVLTGENGQELHTAINMDNCPATVRMVSSNGPPVPMPMQVPPGHMVQQIVDEHGILTHVILSPQPPGPTPPLGPYGGPASGSQYYTSYGAPHYAPSPAQYPVPPHVHVPHIQSPTPPNCTNHGPVQSQGEYGASPPLNSTDDRTLRTRNRVRKKLQQRRINSNDGFYPTPQRSMGGRRNRGGMGVNGEIGMHGDTGPIHGHCITPENGPMDVEEENTLITQCLSTMPAPKVTDVDARSSLIQLSPPEMDSTDLELDHCDLKYELLLSDKGKDAKYKTVFCGDATEITLKDLKPATEYHLKVCAVFGDDLKGALTEPVSFQTLTCEPDVPQPPKLMTKTKTFITLKWNATCENGSKITAYLLEYDQGLGDGSFREVYSGPLRQFKVTRLNASTRYMFRLAAVNSLGKSPYSEVVSIYTSGSVPSQPDPPMLSEQFVFALTISWIRRPNDDEFLLQMEDETTGHGFIPVYNGPNLSYTIRNLRRNTEYRFRLSAKNEEGQSKWSETVCYKTLPERPHPPSKPQIKGKVNPYSFRITWDPPSDSGGTEITKYIVELDDGQGYDTVYEGSEREHVFDHLTPGHTYRVRVACCSIGGRSDFSDCCVATTLPVAPNQCQVPKLQGKPKATSLHLRWGYPDHDGGAQVTTFAAQMISPDNTTREVYKGHDRDCIVAGLLPGRPYLFQVRAFNRAGAGPWSEPLEVISGAGVPEAPRPPQVLCRSAHNALVSWEEPFNNGANISEYRLEWQQKTDTADFTQLYVGPNQSFDAKGLTPATLYTFRVQATNSAGPGPFSPSTPCVTPPSSPSQILSIKVQANATSALLTWREPNCNGSDITSYNIDLVDKPLISVDSVTEHLLEDLAPETTYKIRVQAVNGIGVGAFSGVIKFLTKALPPSPPRLECVMLAPTSIKLKWGEGRNPDLLTYTLEMEKEDGIFQPVYTGPAHTHKVTRLSELTSYEFRIFASNEAGSGPYSDTYSFTTTKAPPPPLKAPKVDCLTHTGCVLEWQGVKPMGGDAMSYVLQLYCMDGRDAEYKQIYKGPNTQYQLEGLAPNTEYQARVAAVRLSSDTGDIVGAFSPAVVFSPLAPEPLRSNTHTSTARESGHEERAPLSDSQWAALILLLFVVLAVITAFLLQQWISYSNSVEEVPASSTSSSSHTS
ncbi:fibronectin type-III domain-containing protein 3A-like isoform X2 [Physella acuta]|uniref:fibronectin type-III domain-containing protein 3A-like isoform X2 n=1 Tax=Physella acuta TaxID=109671 RepID=UPI0027DE1F77|nr:fibronectin type-III domain-containing protein 3A-like isoform X2 [Physella acuta]